MLRTIPNIYEFMNFIKRLKKYQIIANKISKLKGEFSIIIVQQGAKLSHSLGVSTLIKQKKILQ